MPLCAGVNQMRGPAVQLLFAATWQGDTIEEWPIFTDMLSYLPDVCINAEIVGSNVWVT